MTQYIHYLPGGGLGDVYREAVWHNAVGILKRWKTENPTAHLTVMLMSHNPSSADLLYGQEWIDEIKAMPFPATEKPDWNDAWVEYAAEFDGKVELRFNIADRRSTYRAGFAHLRGATNYEFIPAIGTSWQFVYTAEELATIENYAGRLVLHFNAGEDVRAVPQELRDVVLNHLPLSNRRVIIGANYQRTGHSEETGVAFSPRVLAAIIARSRGVLGTDSAPCYFASCLGVPRCMIYPPDVAFDRMTRGDNNWDWYFGLKNPDNLFVRLPAGEKAQTEIIRWIHERMEGLCDA